MRESFTLFISKVSILTNLKINREKNHNKKIKIYHFEELELWKTNIIKEFKVKETSSHKKAKERFITVIGKDYHHKPKTARGLVHK